MSNVANQRAINETIRYGMYAIFITRRNIRYAVKDCGVTIKTYKEGDGVWERVDNLSNFLVWNAEFQGHDDISSLIEE
ncbi:MULTISPECIES: hypothetical protein [Gammaproteobacteria]|uniref:hypothetical protein n=1 Tax=Gammaproteobacteria TaxID=1236 RepID=UPI002FCB5B94